MNAEIRQYIAVALLVVFLLSLKQFPRFWLISFSILRKCWFVFFMGLFILFAFGYTGQGRSIVQEIDFSNTAHRKYVTLFVLWLWAFNSFHLARMALKQTDVARLSLGDATIEKKIRITTLTLCGLFPFIISIGCFLVVRESPDPGLFTLMLIDLWLFLVFLLLSLHHNGLLSADPKYLHTLGGYIFYPFFRKKQEEQGQGFPLPRFMNWFGHLAAFVAICVWPIAGAKFFGPIGLAFIASSFFVIIGTAFVMLQRWTIVPVFPVLLFTLILFTAVSDNNGVGVLDRNYYRRPTVEERFTKWINQRSDKDTVRITLVAAEGGGLRSAFWTYGALRKLQETNPAFFRSVFAISSVSGGSIGSALFCSEHLEGYTPGLVNVPILNDDNMSPMIAALLFRELVQSLIPFDLPTFDRSTIMDETFALHYRDKHPGSDFWRSDFCKTWNHVDSLPSLLINSIQVESGVSVVLSNLSFDTTIIQSTDLLKYMQPSLSISKAVGLSARFPYLQPAGKYQRTDGSTWGHLADGGYFENSGLAVTYQLYLHLRLLADRLIKTTSIKSIQFNLLLLRNGQAPTAEVSSPFLNEINSPLSTLLNSWYTRSYSFSHIASQNLGHGGTDRFFELGLQKSEHPIPLGWFLSTSSRKELVRQVNALTENEEFRMFNKVAY